MTGEPRFNWPDDMPLRSAIMQALGAASMCWENPEGAGRFFPERAILVGDELEAFVRLHYQPVDEASRRAAEQGHPCVP